MLWKKEIETKKLPDNCRLYTYISSARRGSLMHWKYDVHNISFIHFLKEEQIDHLYWYKQKKIIEKSITHKLFETRLKETADFISNSYFKL